MTLRDLLRSSVRVVRAFGDDTGSGAGGGGGDPEWLPRGATFHADFVNGRYWNKGLTDNTGVLAPDIVDWGDSSAYSLAQIGASGYAVDATDDLQALDAVVLPPSNLTDAPNLTAVIEVSVDVATDNGIFGFQFYNGTDTYRPYLECKAATYQSVSDNIVIRYISTDPLYTDTFGIADITWGDKTVAGINRFAATVDANGVSVSLNGGEVLHIGPPSYDMGDGGMWAALGVYAYHFSGHVRSITLYPVKTDAELVTLSTVS